MGKSSPSLPAAPDPAQTSAAQASANMGTARVSAALNRVNQSNPIYQTSWTKGYQQPSAGGGAGKAPGAIMEASAEGGGGGGDQGVGGNQGGDGTQGDTSGTQPPSDGQTNDATANPDVTGDAWTETTTLSPEQQRIFNQQQQLQGGAQGMALGELPKIQGALDQTVNYNGLPQNVTGVNYGALQSVDPNFARGDIQSSIPGMGDLTTGVSPTSIQTSLANVGGPQRTLNTSDPTQLMSQAAQTLYGAQSSLFQPQIEQGREELRQSLADRGIPEDSESGMRELRNFDNSAGITAQQAAASAVTGAQNLAPTLFGMDLSKFNAENTAQGQQFTQGLQSGEFGNEAQQLVFGQGVTNANLNNAAQQQQFQADQAQGTFANQAQNQDFSQQQQQQQLATALRAQGLSEQEINAQLAAAARSAGYTEQQNVRMQPITDTRALLGATGG